MLTNSVPNTTPWPAPAAADRIAVPVWIFPGEAPLAPAVQYLSRQYAHDLGDPCWCRDCDERRLADEAAEWFNGSFSGS